MSVKTYLLNLVSQGGQDARNIHFGYLPVTCYADRIYFNRDNRAFLKGRHIRAAGKPSGRPAKEMRTEACKAQAVKDMGERNEAGDALNHWNIKTIRGLTPYRSLTFQLQEIVEPHVKISIFR